MDFLRGISEVRQVSVSEVIRSIISEYRRGIQALETLQKAIKMSEEAKLSHGDTETDKHNLV
jgi:hypothetical protein